MDEKIGSGLEKEILRVEEELKKLTPGTEEYAKVADMLKLLHQTRLEGVKVELDFDDRRSQHQIANGRADEDLRIREHEARLREDQFEDQKKERWIKVVIAGLELFVPIVFYSVWMKKGLKFESTGTFTSGTFRNLWSRFRPFAK